MPETLGPSTTQTKAPVTKHVDIPRRSRWLLFKQKTGFYNKIIDWFYRTSQASGLRTYSDIVNSGAYNQPDYQPRPTSKYEFVYFLFLLFIFIFVEVRTDKEKDRLAHLMAYGVDPTKMAARAAQRSPTPPPPPEIDRFDECIFIFLCFKIWSMMW